MGTYSPVLYLQDKAGREANLPADLRAKRLASLLQYIKEGHDQKVARDCLVG